MTGFQVGDRVRHRRFLCEGTVVRQPTRALGNRLRQPTGTITLYVRWDGDVVGSVAHPDDLVTPLSGDLSGLDPATPYEVG